MFHDLFHGLFHVFSFSLCFTVGLSVSWFEVSRSFPDFSWFVGRATKGKTEERSRKTEEHTGKTEELAWKSPRILGFNAGAQQSRGFSARRRCAAGTARIFCFVIQKPRHTNHEISMKLFMVCFMVFSCSLCFAVVLAISWFEVSRNFHEICHGLRGAPQRGKLRHARGKLRNARGKLRNTRGNLHEISTPAPRRASAAMGIEQTMVLGCGHFA